MSNIYKWKIGFRDWVIFEVIIEVFYRFFVILEMDRKEVLKESEFYIFIVNVCEIVKLY